MIKKYNNIHILVIAMIYNELKQRGTADFPIEYHFIDKNTTIKHVLSIIYAGEAWKIPVMVDICA